MGGKAVIDIQEKLTTGMLLIHLAVFLLLKEELGRLRISSKKALGVDAAGTDNSTDVTLATVSNNYYLFRSDNNSRYIPVSLGGTGATSASAARTALGVLMV